MIRTYIASPFRGTTKEETRQNIIYARLCMLDSLERGESPYLSHLLYTQIWSEDPTAREAGLAAGDAWREVCDTMAAYDDLGITPGMQRAIDKARMGTCVARKLFPTLSIAQVRAHLSTLVLGGFPELER